MNDEIQDLHPSRLVDGTYGRLIPQRFKRTVRITIVVLAWYGLISAALNILSSLRWIIDSAMFLAEQSQWIANAFTMLAALLHVALAFWRALTQPLYDLLLGWWPFDVPRELLDLLIIASIIGGGYLRGLLSTRQERRLSRLISSIYSYEGRIALTKRLMAGLDVIEKNPDDPRLVQKGQDEIRNVLREMRPHDAAGDRLLRQVLALPLDEMRSVLRLVADAPLVERTKRREIMIRSAAVGGTLLAAIIIDAIYVGWR